MITFQPSKFCRTSFRTARSAMQTLRRKRQPYRERCRSMKSSKLIVSLIDHLRCSHMIQPFCIICIAAHTFMLRSSFDNLSNKHIIWILLQAVETDLSAVVMDYLHATAYQGTSLARSVLGSTNSLKYVSFLSQVCVFLVSSMCLSCLKYVSFLFGFHKNIFLFMFSRLPVFYLQTLVWFVFCQEVNCNCLSSSPINDALFSDWYRTDVRRPHS